MTLQIASFNRVSISLFALLLIQTFIVPSLTFGQTVNVEHYGQLPEMRNVTISPDAKYYASISVVDGDELFLVREVATGKNISGARLGELKARAVYFIDSEHIVFRASETTQTFGYRGRYEASGAFVMNVKTRKITPLLNGTSGLHPAQSGLGEISGFNAKTQHVYMPAYEAGISPANHLYKVDLGRGKGRIYKRGNSSTIDWFVGDDGQLLAREDYVNKAQLHRVYSFVSGKRKLVYETKTPTPDVAFQAVSSDQASLLFIDEEGLKSLSLDSGDISLREAHEQGALISHLQTDLNKRIVSVAYQGLLSYEKPENLKIRKLMSEFQTELGKTDIRLVSKSADQTKIVIKVSGSQSSGRYLLYDLNTDGAVALGSQYPNVERSHLGEIMPVNYEARDGWKIPALLTWPTGVASGSKNKLPLIVLPHGGPASYDHIQFDWWAQFLARKGYLVLQPNFRGSTGFGADHQDAGEGEWGKLMQDDVSDGVSAMVDAGYADPDKVCIMGASYGGYSSLAGAAFSPELYRCVVSVAGVSDLPMMLSYVKDRQGEQHWINRYWKRVIGDSKSEREKLKDISPARFADTISAPVLLIHGKDDLVVPFKQSRTMQRALKKEGKVVELVKLKGEDHWLSSSETRLMMLEAISGFLDQHNPAN